MKYKLTKVFVASIALLALSQGASAANKFLKNSPGSNNSPFKDNVTVVSNGLPAMSIAYAEDNEVYIEGATSVAAGARSFVFDVRSSNLEESGQPTMTLAYNGISCAIQFFDGPITYLAYAAGGTPSPYSPPKCGGGLTVENIMKTADNTYVITINYTAQAKSR